MKVGVFSYSFENVNGEGIREFLRACFGGPKSKRAPWRLDGWIRENDVYFRFPTLAQVLDL